MLNIRHALHGPLIWKFAAAEHAKFLRESLRARAFFFKGLASALLLLESDVNVSIWNVSVREGATEWWNRDQNEFPDRAPAGFPDNLAKGNCSTPNWIKFDSKVNDVRCNLFQLETFRLLKCTLTAERPISMQYRIKLNFWQSYWNSNRWIFRMNFCLCLWHFSLCLYGRMYRRLSSCIGNVVCQRSLF